MLKITTEAVKEAAEVRPPSNSKAARRDSTHWAKYNLKPGLKTYKGKSLETWQFLLSK